MTTMTSPAGAFASHRHHPLTTGGLVVLFWALAAALVLLVRIGIEPLSPVGGEVAVIGALVLTAAAYTRLVSRQAGVSHALGVGIAWLSLSIVTEVALATSVGHGWYSLLGSPDQPLLRNVCLFTWIFAPVLFARREDLD